MNTLLTLVTAIAVEAALLPTVPRALPRGVRAALETIQPSDAYVYTKTLAAPEYAGRLTGHDGYTAAAEWAARRFKDWGLRPLSAALGYLQPYPSPFTIVDEAEMTLLLTRPGAAPGREPETEEVGLVPEKDFLPLLFTDGGSRTGGLVFAGWGISAPDLNYDDYAGLDVTGKFVLCFRGTPDGDPKWQTHDEHRTRMATAHAKGAVGIVYIYPEIASNPNGDLIEGFTPALIAEKTADRLLQEIGTTAADLRKDLGLYKRPISFPLRSRVRVDFAARHFPEGVGYNVVGWIEGADPKLRREVVVVGAHFDHTGRHLGLLFPGANDNASGSAAVMEAAEAFARLSPKPKRSVAFVLFGGEEMGLQGSAFFVEHLPPQFGAVDGMLNFDMVGAGDALGGAAGAEPAAFRAAIEEAGGHLGTLGPLGTIRGVGVRGSDFAPFFRAGVPAASFSSNGPHLAYHQTGDTIFRINPDIIAQAARLAFLAAWLWSDR